MNAVAEALNAVVRDELRDALEEVSKLRAGYETMKEAYDKLRAERAAGMPVCGLPPSTELRRATRFERTRRKTGAGGRVSGNSAERRFSQ